MMGMGKGDKLRCRHRSLGTGIVAAMLNPLTTATLPTQGRGCRLRRQCHTDRETCLGIPVLPGMDTLGHLNHSSKINIMIPDILHNRTFHGHQQNTLRQFAQTLHNHTIQRRATLQPIAWRLAKIYGSSYSEAKATQLSLRATNARFGGIGRTRCNCQTGCIFCEMA